jgi:precorrin-2 dehydrogenase/sirohydrochlorin ferrochelatase
MNKSYYPVNLDVFGRKCLVAGGGAVAERKVGTLLDFGARVIVVSTSFTPGLLRLGKRNKIRLVNRKFKSGDIEDAFLIIAATDDRKTNEHVSNAARKAGVLVNVVDQPKLCSFIAPSVIKRGPLVVSISTSGQAPLFAKAMRLKLEKFVTPALGKLAVELGKIRRQKLGTATDRA